VVSRANIIISSGWNTDFKGVTNVILKNLVEEEKLMVAFLIIKEVL
jgi:hypothetical protein